MLLASGLHSGDEWIDRFMTLLLLSLHVTPPFFFPHTNNTKINYSW